MPELASAILAELKPTFDQIRALAASALGQIQIKDKKKNKKNKK